MSRYRVWSYFIVPWVGFALFWAEFGPQEGTYAWRLLGGALGGLIAVGIPFLLKGGLVQRLLRRRLSQRDRVPPSI